jgi:hypothetical protein
MFPFWIDFSLISSLQITALMAAMIVWFTVTLAPAR